MGSYAWVPGSTGCLRCVSGVPTCIAGTDGGQACSGSGTASAGYSVLQPTQLSSCGLSGAFAVPAYGQCASWDDATPSLQWSLYVAGVSGALAGAPCRRRAQHTCRWLLLAGRQCVFGRHC